MTPLERMHRSGARRARRSTVAFASLLAIVGAGVAAAGAPGPDEEPPDVAREERAGERTIAPAVAEPVTDTPVMSNILPRAGSRALPSRPVLDPSARLLDEDEASEAWTLYVELESGHRVTQRFLLTNAGPGEHSAVAVGHLVEPGRAPYRYENGRRRSRWTLSDDRLFFDIAASHLDLHRPKGELRITKDDIEIRLFFDFPRNAPSARVPAERLPRDYHVDVLAVGAETTGSILAPWMDVPVETRGRTWLVHTWTEREEVSEPGKGRAGQVAAAMGGPLGRVALAFIQNDDLVLATY